MICLRVWVWVGRRCGGLCWPVGELEERDRLRLADVLFDLGK